MEKIKWNDELSVNNSEIDEQHKVLLGKVNDFIGLLSGSGEEPWRVITDLGNYVVYHFTSEEKIMIKNNYPGYHLHKNEHELLIAEYNKLVELVIEKTLSDATLEKYRKRIVSWLEDHIVLEDKKLGKFLSEKHI